MKKAEIQIPKQYLYLSDYSELLGKLPQTGKYIINKVRTGCGGTTLFLKSPDPTIIVSPRFNVLVSKRKQFPNSFLYGENQKMKPEKKKEFLKNYLQLDLLHFLKGHFIFIVEKLVLLKSRLQKGHL